METHALSRLCAHIFIVLLCQKLIYYNNLITIFEFYSMNDTLHMKKIKNKLNSTTKNKNN